MKRIGWSLLACLILLSAAGCAPVEADSGASYEVFYAKTEPYSDGAVIGSEAHMLSPQTAPEDLIALMVNEPNAEDLRCAVPDDVTIVDWTLEEGVFRVELSEAYSRLSGIDLTIADYCITLTLCQLEDVRSVTIDTAGDTMPSRTYEMLRPSDVILSALEDNEVSMSVGLYFPTAHGSGVRREEREVLVGGDMTRVSAVVNALMQGPQSGDLNRLWPEDVVLLSTSLKDGVCYVDFSAELGDVETAHTRAGALSLYSVVDTLCNLSGIETVQLLIEGVAPNEYGGISTLTPLKPDYSIVEK